MLQNLIFWSDIFLYWMISLYFWYDQLLRSLKDLKLLRNFTFCVSALVKLYPGYCITVHICWYTFQKNERHNVSVSTFYAKTISSNLKTIIITLLFNSIMQFKTILNNEDSSVQTFCAKNPKKFTFKRGKQLLKYFT